MYWKDKISSLSSEEIRDLLIRVVDSLGLVGERALEDSLELYRSCRERVATDNDTAIGTLVSQPEKSLKSSLSERKDPRSKAKLNFDITKFKQRQIAFQVQYDGIKYAGFAAQDGAETVENHLFLAFEKLNLISDKKSCNYSRCGRTDKGVSAFGQVISLKVRSIFPVSASDRDLPLHPCDLGSLSSQIELDYCTMVNKVLPEDIRLIGSSPVTEEFSARFSASFRQYRYFFLRRQLDLDAMQLACKMLVGSHDFRNICKLDVANVSNFVREIFSAEIKLFKPVSDSSEDLAHAIWMLEIKGIAFLWHMVRCIMSVLFMIGEGKESPSIVQKLLNIHENPAKPSYMMADDSPLVLHECGFDNLYLFYTPRNLWNLTAHFESIVERHSISAARAKNALENIKSLSIRQRDVDKLKQELVQRQNKTNKRIQDKGLAKDSSPTKSSKRKIDAVLLSSQSQQQEISVALLEEEEPSSNSSDLGSISWREALHEIATSLNMIPQLDSAAHIPLLMRKREESYEERLKALGGLKKERFERHATINSANEEESMAAGSAVDSKQFFERMRKQGTIS